LPARSLLPHASNDVASDTKSIGPKDLEMRPQ